MWIWNNEQDGKSIPKTYLPMDKFPEIKGYSFDEEFDLKTFLDAYLHMGFQGSHLGKAIELFKAMVKEQGEGKTDIFLSFTGNMISSGNRELITYLLKHQLISGVVTTAAAIEEDIIKCIKPFHLGSFDVKGKFLQDEGVGRIGNIFAPYDRYLFLEEFLTPFFTTLYEQQQKEGVLSTVDVSLALGSFIGTNDLTKEKKETSFLYWSAKHNIPVYVPGITDGAFGDISTFFKKKHEDFCIDMVGDNSKLTKQLMDTDHASCLVLGGGISKHFLLNAAIFRDGFERAIYVTTALEHDGSDSGGNQEEAITWAKIKPHAERVKVFSDATIVLPLLLAGLKTN